MKNNNLSAIENKNPILIGMEKGIKRIETLILMDCNGSIALKSLKTQLENRKKELIKFKNKENK